MNIYSRWFYNIKFQSRYTELASKYSFINSTKYLFVSSFKDIPGGSDSKSVCLQCGRSGCDPCVRKVPWRRKWPTTPVLLPGKSHGQKSQYCYSLMFIDSLRKPIHSSSMEHKNGHVIYWRETQIMRCFDISFTAICLSIYLSI